MSQESNGKVTLSIPLGALEGRKQATLSGRPYCSFQGIRYAKPPLGPLRFMAPEPIEPWSGIHNATVEGNMAPQLDYFTKEYMGNEDCLFLNVYTPKIPTNAEKQLMPVMVWIHGGAYCLGSGNCDFLGPDYFLDNEVVFVTLNYRLGVLGFLSTGDDVIPGNAGLKDQVMALKWVKSYISYFGGDPGNVTIFGGSSGAFSCHLLILSPATKGLFHKAILQSGSTSRESVRPSLRDRSFRLAKFLGFTGDNSEDLLAFMREQLAQDLVKNLQEALTEEEKLRMELIPVLPTIEPENAPNALITKDPLKVLKSGNFHNIPIIIGINSREGIFFLQGLSKNEAAMGEMNTNFHKMLPGNLLVNEEDRITIAREIKQLYFGDRQLEESNIELYGDLRADLMFGYPAYTTARIHSSVPDAMPVYFYYFDVVSKLNQFKKIVAAEHLSGAAHADEQFYIFNYEVRKDASLTSDSVEEKTTARLTRLWTNFAKTGNPTPDPHDPLLAVTWTPFRKDDCNYLHITNDGLTVTTDLLDLDRMNFWDKIFGQ